MSGEYVVVAGVVCEAVNVAAAAAALAGPVVEVEPGAVAEQQVVVEVEPERAEAFEDGTQAVELQALARIARLVEGTIAAVAALAEDIVRGVVSTAAAVDAAVLGAELLPLEQEATEAVEEGAYESAVADKASPT